MMERGQASAKGGSMPSLFRFLFVLGILFTMGWGTMIALVYLYEPKPREMSVSIAPQKLNSPR
jgi:hypothetical protein